MKMSRFGITLLPLTLLAAWSATAAQDSYEDLVRLNQEILELGEPEVVDGVPDLDRDAIKERSEQLEDFRKRLHALEVGGWKVEQQVDYLLVWSKLNNIVFDHRVMQPWARDPLTYLYQVSSVPYSDVPETDEERDELKAQLESVPRILSQAEENLTDAVGELAKLAVFHLENFDGVGQGEPYRDRPPEGTIGWFEDLCGRLEARDSSLLGDCRDARAAAVEYRDWLNANLQKMDNSAAIGTENFNWYLKHVRLLPHTVEDLKRIGSREFHRYRYLYIVDRNRNERLPELELTRSAEQHERRTREAEQKIRGLVKEQDLLTIPDYMPDEFETDVFWSPRALTQRHFWEEIQFRNALNNHVHASIPGHRFDAKMRERHENPIRRTHGESARAEGWATYLEELLVQAGITDDNPRARELFYTALIKRGSRFFAEIGMHTGEMTLAEANAYMLDWVPYMEENLGRYDLAGYLRRPGLGSMYLLGKTQIEQLVSERAFQLGEEFDLGDFHDEFLSRGVIPVTLIRWEMTGLDDEVESLWHEVTGKPFPAND
jgi:hypothetical protein